MVRKIMLCYVHETVGLTNPAQTPSTYTVLRLGMESHPPLAHYCVAGPRDQATASQVKQ